MDKFYRMFVEYIIVPFPPKAFKMVFHENALVPQTNVCAQLLRLIYVWLIFVGYLNTSGCGFFDRHACAVYTPPSPNRHNASEHLYTLCKLGKNLLPQYLNPPA